MIIFQENKLTTEQYLALRQAVKWRELKYEQAQKALENSIYIVAAYDDEKEKLVGMGRLVGDGAVICYVQDLIISPCEQHSGLGSMLLKKLIDYTISIGMKDSRMMLDLMCAKGREEFYIKNGFIARPTEQLGPGMIMYLDL